MAKFEKRRVTRLYVLHVEDGEMVYARYDLAKVFESSAGHFPMNYPDGIYVYQEWPEDENSLPNRSPVRIGPLDEWYDTDGEYTLTPKHIS